MFKSFWIHKLFLHAHFNLFLQDFDRSLDMDFVTMMGRAPEYQTPDEDEMITYYQAFTAR